MTEGLVRNQLSSKERREGQAETGHQGIADELGVEVRVKEVVPGSPACEKCKEAGDRLHPVGQVGCAGKG